MRAQVKGTTDECRGTQIKTLIKAKENGRAKKNARKKQIAHPLSLVRNDTAARGVIYGFEVGLGMGLGLVLAAALRQNVGFGRGRNCCFGWFLKNVHIRSVAGTLLWLRLVPGHM
jgi:hypothetical protein